VDDDRLLIQRYLEGNISAFDELFRRHAGSVYTFILHHVRDRTQAEDTLQEVFIRMLTHLHKYRHEGRLRAWLIRIALNLIVDQARQHKAAKLVSIETHPVRDPEREDGPTLGELLPAPERQQPERIAERRELAAAAKEALAGLAPAQRDVFLMRQAELSFKEIARLQGCSINTALGRMHHAVMTLQRRLVIFGASPRARKLAS